MNNAEIETWAKGHNCDIEIAKAIHRIAGENESHMISIWLAPTKREWEQVWILVTKGGQLDGNGYFWNRQSTLGNNYRSNTP